MILDFLNILTLVTILAGVIWLVDIILRKKNKSAPQETTEKTKPPIILDYARSFFPILLIVLLIRSFLFQPYRVPTGSLEPTIMPTALILVSQYDYGLRIPLWNKVIVKVHNPKAGDIALFRWPVNPAVTFVKRVIAVPGDRVSYINKKLYINDKPVTQKFVKNSVEIGDGNQTWPVKEYQENLNGIRYNIFIRPDRATQDFKNLLVPPGAYLMMGDNRDDSDDSRSWGFVSNNNLVGRALLIWMSWDPIKHRVRWHEIGNRFHISK